MNQNILIQHTAFLFSACKMEKKLIWLPDKKRYFITKQLIDYGFIHN